MVFRNLLKGLLLAAVMLIGIDAAATVPVSGNYYIKNVKLDKYVKVTGAYAAEPNAATKADASNIRVGVVGKLADGTYQMNSLASTYGADNTPVECYDYVGRALSIGSAMLQGELKGHSTDSVDKAIKVMKDFVESYAYMRLLPVEGKADTYLSVNTIPSLEKDANGKEALRVMVKLGKIKEATDDAAWVYLKSLVRKYLGESQTDQGLKDKVLRNLDNVSLGKTYLLGGDSYSTFDYVAVDPNNIVAPNDYFLWKLIPYTAADVTESGVYKVHNVGNGLYVKVTEKYYAKPNATEDEATEIHVTSNGTVQGLNGGKGTKVTSLGCTLGKEEIEISNYVSRGIAIGQALAKAMLKDKVSDAKQQAALDYLNKFVTENAYMVLEPVAGTDYVYAYATFPVIPDSVKDVIVKYGVTKGVAVKPANRGEVWQYLLNLVKYYLGEENNKTNSTLKRLVLNNIDNIKEGVTYYLKADADNTFGYVEAANANLQDKTLWWGTEVEKTDAKAESGFYKIHNIGLDKYVNVESKYYARPNVDADAATPIHVGLNAQNPDGSWDLNSLAGNTDGGTYVECYDYVDRAINIGKAAVASILEKTNTSDENKQKADEYLEKFVKENAYMSIRPVPGQDNAFYAFATIPAVPDTIKNIIVRKGVDLTAADGTVYPKPVNEEDVWRYLKDIVRYYLSKSKTDSKLKSIVLNNIDKVTDGHTYYLNGDDDLTFGIVDATEADYTSQNLWWGFDKAFTPTPFSGYYRIRNAQGVDGKEYVNVISHFTARPNLTREEAQKAPGSVIYVKADSTRDAVSLPVTSLRSQGIEVKDYLDGISLCFNNIAAATAQLAADYLSDSTNYGSQESYKKYQQFVPMIEPLITDMAKTVDWNTYVEPTLTSTGDSAYFLLATVPDVAEYCSEANDLLKLMGKDKQWLHDKLASKFGTINTNSGTGKLKKAVLDLTLLIDDPDAFWSFLKQKGINMLNNDNYYQKVIAILPKEAVDILRNNLANVKYGTTYCLTQDKYLTLDFAERDSCTENDAAKWVLEPFTEADAQVDVDTEFAYTTNLYTPGKGLNATEDVHYYTTGFYDFDAQLLGGTEAYTASKTEKYVKKQGKSNVVYYLVKLDKVESSVIPAHTPVVLRSADENGISLKPVGTPTTPAIESDSVINENVTFNQFNTVEQAKNTLLTVADKLKAPRKKVIVGDETGDNLLRGSLLGKNEANSHYLTLEINTMIEPMEDGKTTLNADGLGFWKDWQVDYLKANKAYLYAVANDKFPGFDPDYYEYFDEDGTNAPSYILEFDDEHNYTAVTDVTAAKTVQSVTYVNVAGQQAAEPFEGVNIVITRYTDGTQSATKALLK